MEITKEELAPLVRQILDEHREARIREMRERPEPPTENKLYLISFHSPSLAFPDESGRAVLNHCVYAYVAMRPGASFFGGEVYVIAFGDGRPLPTPVRTVLSGNLVVGLVEVSDERFKSAAGASN